MTTFINQSYDKIHVDHIPRGSAKMDPYTKSAMSIDAVKQIEKNIYGTLIPINSMTELKESSSKEKEKRATVEDMI